MKKTSHSKTTARATVPGFKHVKTAAGISEFILKRNGLRVLHLERKDTGVITTNITYLVGSRDEARGETGSAHMLEHMLFKPTIFDIKNDSDTDSASMEFERDTGCIINANTWKDRTTYYFSYPREYFHRALQIEAQRMTGVVLTNESLAPERNNVLSEHDMRNGDPYFGLAVAMVGAAYHSHPYGHETIGHREDIEDYTAKVLEHFYRSYYRPDNAIMTVIGDMDEKTALTAVKKHFSALEQPLTPIPRFHIREPKQEGLRRTIVERTSDTNIISLGIRHAGFPSNNWFATSALLEILTNGPESILHKAFVDTGIATGVDGSLEPSSEENLGMIFITLAHGQKHEEVEAKALSLIDGITATAIAPLLKKVKVKMLTNELFARDNSLKIVEELTEYTAAGDWSRYTKTHSILEGITVKSILELSKEYFTRHRMTIGYFVGTK